MIQLFLKSVQLNLAPIFTKLFNSCLEASTIPDEWKIAHLTPCYKGKGKKSDVNNYRPISVLSPLSKVFESLIASRMTNYFEDNNLLFNSQFGFRKGLSCELALNTFVMRVRNALENKNYGLASFLDLSKAFDTINHIILLTKLKFYNFDDKSYALLENYLSNRTMLVNVNGTFSKSEKLTVGVPQGSILGPLLFIIFLNDLCALKLSCCLTLFADDITMFYYGKNICAVRDCMTTDMVLICVWLQHNQLILNWDKTKAMFFSYSNRDWADPLTFPTNIYILIDGHDIGFINEFRLLGVTIDNNLTFDAHISNIISKVNSKTFLILKNLKSFPYAFRTILFKLFIVPIFEYCSTTFIHLGNKTRRSKLQNCFNRSIKKLLYIELDHLSEQEQLVALKKSNILPPFYRQFYHFCCFIIIILKNTKLDLFNILNSNKTVRNNYTQPLALTKFMQNSFLVISIKTLNLFLEKLYSKSLSKKCSIDTLKKDVKAETLTRYHKFCNILYTDEFQHRFLT